MSKNNMKASVKISKTFNGFQLNCDFKLNSKITAIFGPSGSGKSTILNCIAGFINADAGSITISNREVFSSTNKRNLPPEERRIGYVHQGSALFPNMTVMKNLEYGYNLLPIDRRNFSPQEMLEVMNISHLSERGVTNLSGGERQRVALARALCANPDLLLLDEPLASVDAKFKAVLIQELKNVSDCLNIPIIFVSHSISEVITLADHVVVLNDGRKILEGHPSIILNDVLANEEDFRTFQNSYLGTVSDIRSDGIAEVRVGQKIFSVKDDALLVGESVILNFQASDVIISMDIPKSISATNILDAKIIDFNYAINSVLVKLDFGYELYVEVTKYSLENMSLSEGQEVFLILKGSGIQVIRTNTLN